MLAHGRECIADIYRRFKVALYQVLPAFTSYEHYATDCDVIVLARNVDMCVMRVGGTRRMYMVCRLGDARVT